MSWRLVRALTLMFLGLLIASPLSSGDKGLWLSLGGAHVQLHRATASRLPAEHTTVVPDAVARPSASRHVERTDASRSLCPSCSSGLVPPAERWTIATATRFPAHKKTLVEPRAPRAPPS